ncbi:hypothetical protein JCM8097_000145 [Rhodosporidiobolus ruineniae]
MSFFAPKALSPADPQDIEVAHPPPDSISFLAWSPQADFLAVSSWSSEVRIYEVGRGGASEGRAAYAHEAPVLAATWSKDGTKIVSGGADNAARLYDIPSGQNVQIGAHDAPVSAIQWVDIGGGIVCTGSWDKTLRYWDMRSSTPVAQVQLPERCYSMDSRSSLLVVGTAERHIQIFNLNNPTVPYKAITSPLRHQLRAVSGFPDATGFALSSVEGRVAVQFVEDTKQGDNFSFKCCRTDMPSPSMPFKKGSQAVYSVNAMAFHPSQGTLATGGSDGGMNIWDLHSRTRLKGFNPVGARDFSRTGEYLAYGLSYDWSKGFTGALPTLPNKVMLHICKPDEVNRKPPKK